MHKFLKILLVIANTIAGLALVTSAWAGSVDPAVSRVAPLVAMVVPVTAPVMLLVLLVDLVWMRRAAIWAVACLAVSAPTILDTMPMHPSTPRPSEIAESDDTFTLMSWNVTNLVDITGSFPGDINPLITFMLEQDADIICMQEAGWVCENPITRITPEQQDSLYSRYPYVIFKPVRQMLAVASKYPVELLPIDSVATPAANRTIQHLRIDVNGRKLTIFNVHLASIGLTPQDKALYRQVTSLEGENRLSEVRHNLLGKVATAAALRSEQTKCLLQFIAAEPRDRDIIVCGDFNDVPASWPVRQLQGQGFSEVGPQMGWGYRPTFHKDRFYFTIDHILYRGALTPVAYSRPTPPWSDHYPLLTTFALK